MWPFCGCINQGNKISKRSAWWIYQTTNIPLNPLKHNREFMWQFPFVRSTNKFSQSKKIHKVSYLSTKSPLEVCIILCYEQFASLLKFSGVLCTHAMCSHILHEDCGCGPQPLFYQETPLAKSSLGRGQHLQCDAHGWHWRAPDEEYLTYVQPGGCHNITPS